MISLRRVCLDMRLWSFFVGILMVMMLRYSDGQEAPAGAGDRKHWSELPVIGIMAQETQKEDLKKQGNSIINGMPVKFLQMGAMRVVPIRLHKTEAYYKQLFGYLNGLLLPGGSINVTGNEYWRVGNYFFNWAKQAFDKGDYFPIFGICLGFEFLNTVVAEKDPLSACDSVKFLDPFRPIKDFRESRIFENMPRSVISTLVKRNATAHYHHDCVATDDFIKDKKLMDFYRVVSTNQDRNGKSFISTIEAYDYPFYGFQWHPEKYGYHLNIHSLVPHDHAALEVGMKFANFFFNETMKSGHRFPMPDVLSALMIDRINPVYFGSPSFRSAWLFNDYPDVKNNANNRL
ncbi:gamma-glutamyl hydrolase-like [Tubulanus polymorphus]|uniref:gamma-glutamyl hydrolase-like n=1 Tax=Tubulanus polymorphus TaxID=672921 RepID=UPI003DA2D3B1